MKQVYISEMMLFISNVLRGNPPKCVSMSNWKCKVRPEIINFDSNKPSFYPYSVKINKYSGSCNNFNDICKTVCYWCC